MEATLPSLLDRLTSPVLATSKVIRWGSPVPSFGDVSRARLATVGLNPSNREFVDASGQELTGEERRFHTLSSLGIGCWSEAKTRHRSMILDSCRAYFLRNPYDGWFRQLEHLISGTNASYYHNTVIACHLDLIPYATACKWTDLSRKQKVGLLTIAGDTLGRLIQDSPISVLVLNGRSVVNQFEELSGTPLSRQLMPAWSLRRGKKLKVLGYAYEGTIRSLGGVEFGRAVRVLGYNHNIQSSFGVTNEVRASIRRWIARAAA